MELIQCSNADKARTYALTALQNLLFEKKRAGVPVLLLLSGGSAFSILENISHNVFGPHMTIGVLDERYSTDENINNFSQLMKTDFYCAARNTGAACVDTRVANEETQDTLAKRMEHALHEWVETHSEGVVAATMGIGADGHTAGIMPFAENVDIFHELFEDEEKWVVSYDAGTKNSYPLRVTVTLPFLRNYIDYAVVYAVGEEKKNALLRVLAEKGSFAETPARIFRDMKNVQLFTER
ncbi:MAG: hypothetical protein G01um101429_343 [Parcubacteria group bacterium Gr01-1014_29]|nr:MAG: hypothetical protein G01um101429_343 [Parcubacteria group bacterium Gr01-1014_29]